MKGAALEKVIEFHFFETTRRAQAFLIARGDVARRGFTLRLGFRAFEDNDLAWHEWETWGPEPSSIVVLVKRNRFRIFIVAYRG